MSGFLFGVACGLMFVVLYDVAIDAWRKEAMSRLEKIQSGIERYEAAKAEQFQAAEDWKRRCIAGLTEARDKCARLAEMASEAEQFQALIDEGRVM